MSNKVFKTAKQNVATPIFQNMVQLVPILTGFLLVASVTYDFAFLKAMNLTFNDIPSSISEHIRSAILWFPLTFFGMFLTYISFAFVKPKTKFITEESKKKETTSNFTSLFIFSLSMIAITSSLVFSIQLIIIIIGIYIYTKHLMYANAISLNEKLKLSLIYTFLFLLSVVNYGYSDGTEMYNPKNQKWNYLIQQDGKIINLKIIGQRRFTDFAILVTENKEINIIPNSSVISTNKHEVLKYTERVSFICFNLKIMCDR